MTEKGKNIAIIAHITIFGLLIALAMNGKERSEYASFYIRQIIGLNALVILGGFIPYVQYGVGVIAIILWILSLAGAASNQKAETPLIGHLFQTWFKGI